MNNNLQVKASLFTLILAFMAIGTFAIAKEVMKKDNSTEAPAVALMETWYFTGDDPKNATHYSSEGDDLCPGLPETVCTITAEANGSVPDLGPQELDDIQDVLDAIAANQTPQANNTVKSFRGL